MVTMKITIFEWISHQLKQCKIACMLFLLHTQIYVMRQPLAFQKHFPRGSFFPFNYASYLINCAAASWLETLGVALKTNCQQISIELERGTNKICKNLMILDGCYRDFSKILLMILLQIMIMIMILLQMGATIGRHHSVGDPILLQHGAHLLVWSYSF